jgi:hypothetical protein
MNIRMMGSAALLSNHMILRENASQEDPAR